MHAKDCAAPVMYRPQNSTVKEFLRGTIVLPTYKKPKPAKCEQVQYFCRTTANHGFAHMVDGEELFCFRLLWGLIVVAFIGIVVMLLYESAVNLVARKLTTEFVDVDGNSEGNGMLLPDIHICEATIFKADVLMEMGFNDTMSTYLALATSQYAASFNNPFDNESTTALENEFMSILEEKMLNMSTVIERAALNCTEILIGCDYNQTTYNAEQCCKNYFKSERYVSIFGSCISTHGTPINQASESRDSGFVVYTRPNTHNSINFDFKLINAVYTLQRGIYYAVSSRTVYIKTVLETDGRFAIPNTWVSLPISKTEIDISEVKDSTLAPYTCVDTTDLNYRQMRAPEYDFYSFENCLDSYDKIVYQGSDECSPMFLKHNSTTVTMALQIFTSFSIESRAPEGFCLNECRKEIYKLSPSSAYYNPAYLTEVLNETDNNTNSVVLHFFYSSFRYQKQIIHVNTYLKFLGEVGGNLGLFLGASLISILEIVALFFRCCLKSVPMKL